MKHTLTLLTALQLVPLAALHAALDELKTIYGSTFPQHPKGDSDPELK